MCVCVFVRWGVVQEILAGVGAAALRSHSDSRAVQLWALQTPTLCLFPQQGHGRVAICTGFWKVGADPSSQVRVGPQLQKATQQQNKTAVTAARTVMAVSLDCVQGPG